MEGPNCVYGAPFERCVHKSVTFTFKTKYCNFIVLFFLGLSFLQLPCSEEKMKTCVHPTCHLKTRVLRALDTIGIFLQNSY